VTEAPRRYARQRRSRELVSAILEAGVQLLENEGDESLTTNRIAERAGVSIGSLYRYFPNKEAILAAIYDAKASSEIEEGRYRRFLEEDLSKIPLEQALRNVVQVAVDRHRRWLSLAPEFYRANYDSFSIGQRMGAPDQMLREFLERYRDVLRVNNLDYAAFLMAQGILSASLRVTVREKPAYLEDPAFVEELVDLIVRYLVREPC